MALENLQTVTYIVISVIFALGTASIFLRLYCRVLLLKSFGWDDAMAVFLLVVNTAQQTVLYMFMHYGCGIHYRFLSQFQLENIVKWLFIEEVFYMFTHWTIKQAFLLFYLRLSPGVTFRRWVYFTMFLNTAFTVVNWLLAFLQCIPFDAIFHRAAHPEAKCINIWILLMLPSVLNIITDIIILVLPISTVLSLHMPLRRKIAVLSVIGFGASAVLIAMLRFIILKRLGTDPDISYVLGEMIIVAALEIEFAVIAVNLPPMKSLWNKLTGGPTSTSGGDGYSGAKAYKFQRSGGSYGRPKLGSNTDHMELTSIDSEKELYGRAQNDNDIKITTKVAVTSAARADSDNDQGTSNSTFYAPERV